MNENNNWMAKVKSKLPFKITFNVVALIVLQTGIFFMDLFLPFGAVTIIAYITVVQLTLWLPKSQHTIYAGIASSAFIMLAFFIGPKGESMFLEIFNRVLALAAVWITAIFVLRYERAVLKIGESESFKVLFEAAGEGLIIANKWGNIISVNPEISKMFGYTQKELKGVNLEMLIPERFWERYKVFKQEFYQNPQVIHMGEAHETEDFYGLRKDGKEFPVEVGVGYYKTVDEVLTVLFVTDITERKLAEKQVLESKEWLTNFMDSSPAFISILDENLKIIDCNQPMLQVFNAKTKQEVIGKMFVELYPKIEESAQLEKYETVLKTGERIIYDQEIEHPLFGHKYFNVRIFKAGHGLGSIIEDVTESKQAAQKVADSRERLTNFIDATNSFITILDQNLNVIDCNKPILKMFNVKSKEEVIGRPLTALLPKIVENGQIEYYKKVLETNQPLEYEQEVDEPLIGHKYYNIRLFNANEGLGSIIDDVTEKRKAQEEIRQYASIVTNSKDMMSLFDKDFNFIIVNEAFAEAFDKKKSDFAGQKMSSIYEISFFEKSIKPKVEKSIKGETVHFQEWVNLPTNGKKYLEFTLNPFYNETNEIIGFSSNIRDITDRKLVLDELRKSKEKLRESNIFMETIIENIPNMIFMKDANTLHFVMFNKAGEELLGTKREDLIGKNDYDFFPKKQADFFVESDREVLRNGKLINFPEEHIDTANGTKILHTKKIPIKNEQGNTLYLLGISEDITEKKRDEEKLRVKDKQYKVIVESSNLAIYRCDIKGNFIYVNPVMTKVTGFPAKELIGLNFTQLISPEYKAMVEEFYKSQFNELKENTQLEFPILTKSGKEIWIEQSVDLIYDEAKPKWIKEFTAIAKDISERKIAEDKLIESEKKLSNFLESLPVGIYIFDANSTPYFANKKTLEMFGEGISPEALKNVDPKKAKEVYPTYQLGTNEIIPQEKFLEDLKKVMSGETIEYENTEVEVEGKRIPLHTILSPIYNVDGKVEYSMSVFEDISERKQFENEIKNNHEHLKAILDSAQDAVITANEEGNIKFFNPAAEKLFGYSMEELKDKPLVTIMPERYVKRHEQGFERYKQTKEAHILGKGPIELEAKRKDGTEFPIELTLASWNNNVGMYFTAVIRDISVRKKMEKKLEEHHVSMD